MPVFVAAYTSAGWSLRAFLQRLESNCQPLRRFLLLALRSDPGRAPAKGIASAGLARLGGVFKPEWSVWQAVHSCAGGQRCGSHNRYTSCRLERPPQGAGGRCRPPQNNKYQLRLAR